MATLDRFAALVLTHGRAERVVTVKSLRRSGYTGPIYLVIDSGDQQRAEYERRYPGQVIVFSKPAIAPYFDLGDNLDNDRVIVFARNACWGIARALGLDHFIQLDDDYSDFRHKLTSSGQFVDRREIKNLDGVFGAMVDFVASTPTLSLAMAQGGDFIGGTTSSAIDRPKRKAMNSFVCATAKPFPFVGRMNEDVNTYTSLGARGGLFLTTMHIALNQLQTQSNAGGMTESYLTSGTYVKSFYSVIFHPSGVKVALLSDRATRIHHRVSWMNTVPCILSVRYRKSGSPA